MATETLDEKKPEAEALAKEKDGAEDFEKETVSRASDGREEKEEVEKAKKEEVKNEETEEKSETDDRESEDEEEEEEEKDDKKEKASEKEPVTPVSDRPKRERKKVERYSLPTPSRSSGSKGVSIEKGRGTQLREIPNVAYKLSKRKPDDNLLLLHTILYGKKAKAQTLKKNIGQFSGYVWSEKEEEKQRMRVKDKLEKCIKEKLIDFCDVLDIPINKSNVRKEALSEKVLEFLEYPKATRDILLADQQGKKRKMAQKNVSSGEASDIPAKKKRQRKKAGKKQGLPSEAEGDDESEGIDDSHEGDNAAMKEESDHKDIQTEEEDEAEDGKSSDKKSSGTKGKEKMTSAEDTRVKSSKGSSKSGQKPSKRAAKSTSSSTKKQKVERESEKDQNDSSQEKGKKQSNKPRARGSKDEGKGKDGKKGKAEPTREEMHAVVANILKEVDFNTATLSDILRKLGDHFSVDLLHRKAEVKDIITEAINNMTDDEEDEEDNP